MANGTASISNNAITIASDIFTDTQKSYKFIEVINIYEIKVFIIYEVFYVNYAF